MQLAVLIISLITYQLSYFIFVVLFFPANNYYHGQFLSYCFSLSFLLPLFFSLERKIEKEMVVFIFHLLHLLFCICYLIVLPLQFKFIHYITFSIYTKSTCTLLTHSTHLEASFHTFFSMKFSRKEFKNSPVKKLVRQKLDTIGI